jgi:hypothetical protein
VSKGVENADGVLALLDPTNCEEQWTRAKFETTPEFRLVSIWFGTKALAIDAIAANRRLDLKILAEAVPPEPAYSHPCVRLLNRTRLQMGNSSIRKVVDVMHRSDEFVDVSPALQRRERVAGDAVVRMIEIEARSIGQIFDIFGDPLFDHCERVARRWRDWERVRPTMCRPEEALPFGVGRVQDDVMPERGQRLGELQRMDDSAARVGGVR